MNRFLYSDEIKANIMNENLLPPMLLNRVHAGFSQYSGLTETSEMLFSGKKFFEGLKGFREIVAILKQKGIEIGFLEERELFIKVYRFLVTRHVLNIIDWRNFENDSIFHLVFPQPGMIDPETVRLYKESKNEDEKERVIKDYIKRTNPHDGKQKLNKPWFVDKKGKLKLLEGNQHKYPQCQLIFDKTTQRCFSFCTYCFRHAQVRGDEDMFIQKDIKPVHDYLKLHQEVTDVLITGGDAGYMKFDRFEKYVTPIMDDPGLMHIKTVRLGSRALTFNPELILSDDYTGMLKMFRQLTDNGIQVLWMAHFSTPREILNPTTIAAIRRLKASGVMIKSQSPVMNHISLFTDGNGKVDIDRSAQNWIDLGNLFAILSVGFHSMYCARPTGEHHYFTAPLADVYRVFSKVYRSLPSVNRPSRYISMTSSAGKISIIGTVEVHGEKAFVLKFNEGRNMEWLDRVFLVKYDENESIIERLKPFDTDKSFYEDELNRIEEDLQSAFEGQMSRKY